MTNISIINSKGEVEVLYEPTEKQKEFHACTQPNVLFYGGRGSGKSMALRWEAHARALATPGFRYVILRRTYPELEKTHLINVPAEMKALGGTYNQTKHIALYPNGSRGFFSHCNTEEDVINLLGAEVYWMGFDEISTFEWDMVTRLSASVRAPKHIKVTPMVRAATNPWGASAEKINQYFVTKDVDPEEDPDYVPGDWHAIKANLEDNPYLPAEYRKRFSGLTSGLRKAWLDGEFSIENALFDFKPKVRLTNGEIIPYHVINDIDLAKVLKASTIYRAIDAGWFPDPTVCLWIAHLGNRHIVFHEKTWYKTTAAEVASDILAEDKHLGISTVAMTYCDPSMDINTTADIRTIKEVYEANGVPMECSINKRDWFAKSMQSVLAEEAGEHLPRIQFFVQGRKGCPMLAKTIPQMKYDPKRTEYMADHKDDHWVVACCYYLMSHASDPRNFADSSGRDTTVRKWMRPKTGDVKYLGHDNVRDSRES